jgi:hypothetical protein
MLGLDEFRARYQLVSLLKKFRFETDAEMREIAAKKTFFRAEISCRLFNMKGWRKLAWSEDDDIVDVFTYARSWIEKVIGCDLPDYDQLTLKSRHGPGASSNTRKGNRNLYFKYSEYPYDCTRRSRGLAITAIQHDNRWMRALVEDYCLRKKFPTYMIIDYETFWDEILNIVPGNTIAFVPKSADTERTIAIEPTMNLYLQLGIDGFIRRRLKRWGINLNDQTKNQVMAKQGSLRDDDKSLCTLDLSMASDTISTTLCRHLLPKAWYHHLLDLRSPVGDLQGKEIRYEKVSSMGNGYTFALESLIFASFVYGATRLKSGFYDSGDCAIYGDDIIVRKFCVPLLSKVLNAAGFKLNTEKSFFKGPIRESCGADWFKGKAVRPVFFRTIPTDIKELFNDYNRLKRTLNLRFGLKKCKSVELIASWIPSKFKTFIGPYSNEEFDTYLHARPNLSTDFYYGSWRFKRLVRRQREVKKSRLNFRFGKLMSRLTGLPDDTPLLIKKKSGYKVTVSSRGSKFDVPDQKLGWYYAYQNSDTDFWCSEYAEG